MRSIHRMQGRAPDSEWTQESSAHKLSCTRLVTRPWPWWLGFQHSFTSLRSQLHAHNIISLSDRPIAWWSPEFSASGVLTFVAFRAVTREKVGGSDLGLSGEARERVWSCASAEECGRGCHTTSTAFEVRMRMYLVIYSVTVCRNVGDDGVWRLAPGLL